MSNKNKTVVVPKDISLDKIVFEPETVNNLYFNNSLTRLRGDGYLRHARPAEVFSILIDALENPASKYKDLAKDMLDSYGEWLSVAFRKVGTKLECVLDPENLVWDSRRKIYVVNSSGLKHSGTIATFDIGAKPSQSWIDLAEFPNDMVKLLCTKNFNDLPKDMREGRRRAQIALPQENVWWPVGRGSYDGNYDLDGDDYYRASRGVREA